MSNVYLLATEDRSAAKIGKAIDVKKRLALLQTGNPKRLEIIATAPGGIKEEAALHAELEGFELSGEWFSDVGTCLDVFWRLPGAALSVGALTKRSLRPKHEAVARALATDPSLIDLLARALNVDQRSECSCIQFYSNLKRDLVYRVGHVARFQSDEWMRSSEAYDAVYFAIWACLPPCRLDVCGGVQLA